MRSHVCVCVCLCVSVSLISAQTWVKSDEKSCLRNRSPLFPTLMLSKKKIRCYTIWHWCLHKSHWTQSQNAFGIQHLILNYIYHHHHHVGNLWQSHNNNLSVAAFFSSYLVWPFFFSSIDATVRGEVSWLSFVFLIQMWPGVLPKKKILQ